MGVLSIFVDESGDFGKYNEICPYYLINLVFHNQNIDISQEIIKLDEQLKLLGYPKHCLHTGPLIRREREYKNININNRKLLLNQFYLFLKQLDIKYTTIIYDKSNYTNELNMILRLSENLTSQLLLNKDKFAKFDTIIIYYDKGQSQVTKILSSVFGFVFNDKKIKFKENVIPENYKLFQATDVICTFELIKTKIDNGIMSNSEKRFFGSRREFLKNYYKGIKKKAL